MLLLLLAVLGSLVITAIIGATLPRWISFVPAEIAVAVSVYGWLVARSDGLHEATGFLFYGAIYALALLCAAAAGRTAHPDNRSQS